VQTRNRQKDDWEAHTMASRRKRLDKKLHNRFVEDVLLLMITSPVWKPEFLGLEGSDSVAIDSSLAEGRMDEASFLIRRFDLHFVLARAEDDWGPDPDPVEDALKFKLQAALHPTVRVYVEEFPDQIGGESGA
jgi:hypothetical protein